MAARATRRAYRANVARFRDFVGKPFTAVMLADLQAQTVA
jgi:hypothetical protein